MASGWYPLFSNKPIAHFQKDQSPSAEAVVDP